MTNTSPENQEAKRRADLDIRGTAERLRADRSSLAEWAGCESPHWRALLALPDGLDGTIVQNGSQFSVRTPDAAFTERFRPAWLGLGGYRRCGCHRRSYTAGSSRLTR